jgi:hypothetical protein
VSKTVAATALFASVSMLMGGAMTALYSRIGRYQSYIMIGGNISTVFGEIPLWIFSILAAVSAFITFFLQKIMHRKVSVERCRIRLAFDDDVCEFDAFVDTGNCVQEPFSGNAIVFVSAPAAQRIGGKYGKMLFLTSESTDAFESGAVRFVPVNTVSGYALVSAVKPRNFEIEINRHFEPRSVFVACDVNARDYNGAEALVPSSLL